jgi:hypothetical protein
MSHHTKDKGDVGLAMVIADLTKNGFNVCLPISEHQAFDLIAANEEGKLCRIQVKYRVLKNGAVEVPFRSVYSNGQGAKAVLNDFSKFDVYAVYCPDVEKIYYYPVSLVGSKTSVALLRVIPPKRKTAYIDASKFEDAKLIFEEVAESGLMHFPAKEARG